MLVAAYEIGALCSRYCVVDLLLTLVFSNYVLTIISKAVIIKVYSGLPVEELKLAEHGREVNKALVVWKGY